MVLFETENMSFTYPLSSFPALKNISIKIDAGELVLITGESGSGKTTLLRLLSKSLAPNGNLSGKININADKTAFVSQNPDTSFVSETVRGELAFALENLALSNDEITLKIGETASFFNLNNMLDRKLSELSGGEKASVSIAAALISDCDCVLLDEPFAELDPKSVSDTSKLIERLNKELGKTVIIVSHTTREVIDFCDKIITLKNGGIICFAPPREAVKNDNILPFFPVCTRVFDERPFTVKESLPYSGRLREKPNDNIENGKNKKNGSDKSAAAVTFRHVSFRYEKDGKDILKRLDFTACRGKINTVIGANGSGKTTLLKLIAGIKKPYSGKIFANGECVYMPQNVRCLFTKETAGDEISRETAKKLGIKALLSNHPYDLSAGQQQKLAFGILLEQKGDIFLLDEPSKAYDEFSKAQLKAFLYELCGNGKTVIMVTHDLDFAGEVSDFVSFLSDGIISKAGGRREVFSSLDFYTTEIRRITRNHLKSAVGREDIV